METVSKMLVALTLLSSMVASSVIENEVFERAREPRAGGIIKSLLPFINFKIKNPFECRPGTSVNGNAELGTCMSQYDCDVAGGRANGECAAGYGKCCVLYANCGDTITRNRTYIISNSTTSTTCSYTINKEKLDFKSTNTIAEAIGACQVRLDFEEFLIGPPPATATAPATPTSLCSEDSFEVTGNQNAFGKICGSNEGQHIYLPISPTSDTIATVTFVRGATSTTTRNWRIRTTYIPCLSNMTAPPGCLQYFTGNTGVIKSFNYVGVPSQATLTQIGGLEYSACISDEIGSCGVSLAATTTTPSSFHLTGAANGGAMTTSTSCGTDYIAILTVSDVGAASDSIFCGGAFAGISTYARPFKLFVRTNSEELAPDVANTGFSLTYNRLTTGC